MILVLSDGEHRVWIDVALKDGCEVRVGRLTVESSNVEPVPWYKVSLLDYLIVNVKNTTLAWVIDSPQRSRTPSITSLHNDSTASHLSVSHDSGCVEDAVATDAPSLATIIESTVSSSRTSLDSGGSGSGRRRGNASDSDSPSCMQGRGSNTLPRVGGSSYVPGGRATYDMADRGGELATGVRRSASDAAQAKEDRQQTADLHSRFGGDRPMSSYLHPGSAAHDGLHSTSASGTAGTGRGDRCGSDGIAIPGQTMMGGGGEDLLYGWLAHEHVLNLSDLLASLENNLDYDTSVVYEIFSLCEKLLHEVVVTAPPDHTRWIEERYAYGRLINDVKHIESLIQILHSHLLPFITLNAEDRSMLKWAVKSQQDTINTLSDEILSQSMQETSLATSIDSLLSRVLPGVEASLGDGNFNRQFLRQLVADIDGRGQLKKLSSVLEDIQSDINQLKKKQEASSGLSMDEELTLQRLRHRRDNAHTDLTDVLKTRELMVLQIQSKRADTGSLLPAQRSYMQACKVHEEQLVRTAALLDKKVAALGMREALQEALQILDHEVPSNHDDSSLATMINSGPTLSKKALLTASLTNVRPELLPLHDAIEEIIRSTDNPIGLEHQRFCEDLITTCNETTVPNILAFGVPRVGAVVVTDILDGRSVGVDGSGRRRPNQARQASVYEVIDPAREYVEDIVTKVTQHMQSIVSQLLKQFPHHSEQLHRKLYLTYEKALFTRTGRTTDDLYTVWSQKVVNQLLRVTEFVESITFKQLLDHLLFPTGWWVSLFHEPEDADEADRRTMVFSPKAPIAPFQRLLAPAAAALHRLLGTTWPLSKAELLTKSIQQITRSLGEYHGKTYGKPGSGMMQVGSDDLVPVVILFILHCKPEIIATLCMNCLLLEDLCPEFLRNGMHGFSLVQFQGALHVIASLLPTEELSPANAEGAPLSRLELEMVNL